MHSRIDTEFPDPTALGTFLDNHDNERWLSQKNDVPLLKNNLAYVILARGIPIVYYGTEQGFAGGADPDNREDLWRSDFNTDSDLYKTIVRLSGARASAGGLPDDDHVHLHVTNNAYAWSRAGGDVIVFTTNTGSGTSGQYCFNSQRQNGHWSNALGNSDTLTSDGNGNLCLSVTNGEPVVLVAATGGGNGDGNNGTLIPTSTATSTAVSSTACPTAVEVTFNVRVTTQLGDQVKVVGNTAELGAWEPDNAIALSANEYTAENPVWQGKVKLSADEKVEYKFVKVRDGNTQWESDPNRDYQVPDCQASASVDASWR